MGICPYPFVSEFFFVLEKPMNVVMFDDSDLNRTYHYKAQKDLTVKLKIPKLGKGSFGDKITPTYLDYFVYTVMSIIMLPYFLFFDTFIFVAPPFFPAVIVPFLRLARKKIYVVAMDAQTETSLYINKRPSGIKKAAIEMMRRLEEYTVEVADKVFVVSRFLYRKYKKINDNVYHVPNGADTVSISRLKAKRKYRNTIIYIGGFEHFRGVDMLIAAFNEMKRKDFRLVLIGGGSYAEEIQEMAKHNPRITMTGFVSHDEAMSLLKGAYMAVMPNRNVVLSKTISSVKGFEYIAAETPYVVTDSGEHAYWTRKLETGIVAKDNAESIRKAMEKLISDKKLYSRLKNNCRKAKEKIDYKVFRKLFVKEVLSD